MAKTSTTVGPTAYARWREIKWIRKVAVLERMVGRHLDIIPRQRDYVEPTEVEHAIEVIWNLDKLIEEA